MKDSIIIHHDERDDKNKVYNYLFFTFKFFNYLFAIYQHSNVIPHVNDERDNNNRPQNLFIF